MSQIKTKFVENNAITNAKAAQMPTLTIKGNDTGGTANAKDLTVAEVNSILGTAAVAQDVADLVTLSGVAANETDLGTFTGTTIPDDSDIKEALQALETSVETKADSSVVSEIDTNVNDLITLSGVAENATDLGTFTGTTIPDSSTIKAALQSLETAVEAGSGATTELDNLTTTAINADLLPDTDDTHSLGSSSLQWAEAHVADLKAQDVAIVNDASDTPQISLSSTSLTDNLTLQYNSTTQDATIALNSTGDLTVSSSAGHVVLDSADNLTLRAAGSVIFDSTGDIDAGSSKITQVADPTADQDAATKKYVDDSIDALPDPIVYQGTYNATTDTPALQNTDTGVTGYMYQVTVAGSQDFGAGAISFEVGDKVVNNGTVWEKWDMTDAVSSVNGATGAVVLALDDLDDVDAATPNDGDVLAWDSGVSNWVNVAPAVSTTATQENITLSGTDITNQYVDLAEAVQGSSAAVNSVQLSVDGGPQQLKAVDYTVSLTGGAGGVTRITFAGDLATGGGAALVATDILMISYSY